jgi:hypothetical protein
MIRFLFRFLVTRMFAAEAAELAELQPLRRLLLVLRRAVVPPLTFQARERDDVSHNSPAGWGIPGSGAGAD